MKKTKSCKRFKVPSLNTLLREMEFQSNHSKNELQNTRKDPSSSSKVDENDYFTFSKQKKENNKALEPASMSKFFNLSNSPTKTHDFFKCSLAFRMHKVISSKIQNL